MESSQAQVDIIHELFSRAEDLNIPLWLESGWAIDARLGYQTRAHEDIDIAFPDEKMSIYTSILKDIGFVNFDETDYGFLMSFNGIIVDSEPCFQLKGTYNFPHFPQGSCPQQREGILNGYAVRCLSWEAMFFEFLEYENKVPSKDWRPKDYYSYEIILNRLTPVQIGFVRKRFQEFMR